MKICRKGQKSRKPTKKLEVSLCIWPGRSVYHISSWVSTQGGGVDVHESWTCSLTHRSTRWNGQARGVSAHATEACWSTCVCWGGVLHEFQSCSLTSGMSGGVLHVSWTCSQQCGARGAAAHASGAMRTNTRVGTNLNLICGCFL